MNYTEANEQLLLQLLNEQRHEISGFSFEKLDLTDLYLKSVVLLDCKFVGCNFANCSFLNVSLRGVVLRTAI